MHSSILLPNALNDEPWFLEVTASQTLAHQPF
ncbi:hypothetical protein P3T16_000911 [Paraburkholderia sp. GAS42]